MKSRGMNKVIFILSIVCLIISIKLFWNIAVYADEFNTSPDRILGGNLWLYMDWLRLAFSILISIIAGINLFVGDNQNNTRRAVGLGLKSSV